MSPDQLPVPINLAVSRYPLRVQAAPTGCLFFSSSGMVRCDEDRMFLSDKTVSGSFLWSIGRADLIYPESCRPYRKRFDMPRHDPDIGVSALPSCPIRATISKNTEITLTEGSALD